MKAYLHTVHRASGTFRRLYLGDAVLEFTVGHPNSMSRAAARRFAARERHAENCWQSRKAGFIAAGHSDASAEILASR